MDLRDFIESRVEKPPAKPFLYLQKKVLAYEGFDRKVNQAANGFLEWGVKISGLSLRANLNVSPSYP